LSALQRDIKKLSPHTLEAINRGIVALAKDEGIEKGRKVRTDCTVTEADIHHPTDSSLLVDGVRVLTRLMAQAKDTITGGDSGLLTDLVIKRGNPPDCRLAKEMIERQRDIYGRVPRQAAFDGGFASVDNLRDIKEMGVKDVVFHRRRGLKVAQMAKSTWVYRRLRNFRAGIEGMISFLKRGFGLNRCNWRGFESFKAYAWSSVLTDNLLLVARHLFT